MLNAVTVSVVADITAEMAVSVITDVLVETEVSVTETVAVLVTVGAAPIVLQDVDVVFTEQNGA